MSNILHSDSTHPDVLTHVAENVRRLRTEAGLSQTTLAETAGVSRRRLVGIEKGDVNVSLNTLDRLADALDVWFSALVVPPEAGDSARINALAWVGASATSWARLLASVTAASAVELWSWSLAPGERYRSDADPPGWQNMIVVVDGRLTVELGDQRLSIAVGDFKTFASDQPYSYSNKTNTTVRFIRNVVY